MNQTDFFNRYKFNVRTDKIGGGSFGTVYKAYDTTRNREVAIKVSETKSFGDKEFSLTKEFEAIKDLPEHPNLAFYEKVYSFDMPTGIYDYALMQYYPDGNLSSYLQNNTLTSGSKEKLIIGILKGIAHLHKYNVVHRDLKPSNILVVEWNGQVIPKITDFGLSKKASQRNAKFTNSFAGGTLQYSSPEQLKGRPLKLNTDLWSFGCIVYEILEGNALFDSKSKTASAEAEKELIESILTGNLDNELKAIDQKWRNILERCMEKDTEKRTQNADDLLLLLQEKTTKALDNHDVPKDDLTQVKEIPKKGNPVSASKETKFENKKPRTETEKKKDSKLKLTLIVIGMSILIGFGLKYMFSTDKDLDSTPEIQRLRIFENKGLYGYKMGNETVIPATYTKASEFQGNYARVSTVDSTFLIDFENNWIRTISYKKELVDGNSNNISKNDKLGYNERYNSQKEKNDSNDKSYEENGRNQTEDISENDTEEYNYNGYYRYVTYIADEGVNPSLYSKPVANSIKVYTCPKNSKVYVIDDSNPEFYKVNVNGRTGYLSNVWLVNKSGGKNNNQSKRKNSGYIYKTTFDDVSFKPTLYSRPNVNSSKVYSCPKNATIYVLETSEGEFYRVRVDNRIGYLSKVWLK